jgi:hypothetical protein
MKCHPANPGKPWDTPNSFPIDVAPYVAKLAIQPAIDCAVRAYRDEGLDPIYYVSIEMANELGNGGNAENYHLLADGSKVRAPGPEGFIEPYQGQLLRTLRYGFKAYGLKVTAYNCEGDKRAIDAELASISGEHWQRLADACSGFGYNRYASNPSLTPTAAAQWWLDQAKITEAKMHANAVIGAKPLFIGEFGMRNDPALMKDLVNFTAADYRNAVLGLQRGFQNGSYFIALPGLSASSIGFNLYNADKSPVSGAVTVS